MTLEEKINEIESRENEGGLTDEMQKLIGPICGFKHAKFVAYASSDIQFLLAEVKRLKNELNKVVRN